MVREETDKTASDFQARSFMARTVDVIGKKCQADGEAKWSIEKPKLANARRLRKIIFIDPGDEEFVKRRSPDTAIHEQNGYAKVFYDKYTFKTNVDN